MTGPDALGWVATAIFTGSYLTKNASGLRAIQAIGAVVWITYGVVIHAMPVVIANLLVAAGALYSYFRGRTDPEAS